MPIKIEALNKTFTPENAKETNLEIINASTGVTRTEEVWSIKDDDDNYLWCKPFELTSTKVIGISDLAIYRKSSKEPTAETDPSGGVLLFNRTKEPNQIYQWDELQVQVVPFKGWTVDETSYSKNITVNGSDVHIEPTCTRNAYQVHILHAGDGSVDKTALSGYNWDIATIDDTNYTATLTDYFDKTKTSTATLTVPEDNYVYDYDPYIWFCDADGKKIGGNNWLLSGADLYIKAGVDKTRLVYEVDLSTTSGYGYWTENDTIGSVSETGVDGGVKFTAHTEDTLAKPYVELSDPRFGSTENRKFYHNIAAETEEYTYSYASPKIIMSGLDPTYSEASAHVHLNAKVNRAERIYKISWYNHDGTLLTTSSVAYSEPIRQSLIPTKEATAQYTYTFDKWVLTKDTSKAIALNESTMESLGLGDKTVNPVEISFTATYSSTINNYTIKLNQYTPYGTWKNTKTGVTGVTTTDDIPYGYFWSLMQLGNEISLNIFDNILEDPKQSYLFTFANEDTNYNYKYVFTDPTQTSVKTKVLMKITGDVDDTWEVTGTARTRKTYTVNFFQDTYGAWENTTMTAEVGDTLVQELHDTDARSFQIACYAWDSSVKEAKWVNRYTLTADGVQYSYATSIDFTREVITGEYNVPQPTDLRWVNKYAVNISTVAADYVKNLWITTTTTIGDKTNLYPSGSLFPYGTTVYYFIEPLDNTAQYTYTAKNYIEKSGDLYRIGSGTVNSEITHKLSDLGTFVQRTLNSYVVTLAATNGVWKLSSGEEVEFFEADYGTSLSISGNKLSIGTAQFTFVKSNSTVAFDYEDPTFSTIPATVTGNLTVTGTAGAKNRLYTINWIDGDGKTIETDSNVKYNAVLTYNSSTPTKTKTPQYTYTFDSWKLGSTTITSGTSTNPGSTDSTVININAQFTSTVNMYTVTYAYSYPDEPSGKYPPSDTMTESVAYGTSVSSTTKYPATWVKATDQIRWIGTGETKTVTGDVTVTTTYATTQYYATISNDNSTCDKTTGWYDRGTSITFTTTRTDTASLRVSYSTESSTVKTCSYSILESKTYSPATIYTWQNCSIVATHCTADKTAGWLLTGTIIYFTSETGTNLKYSFSPTTIAPNSSLTVTLGTNTYTKSADYLFYKVTISNGTRATTTQVSGYKLKGTKIEYNVKTSTNEDVVYSFSSTDKDVSTAFVEVSSAGQSITSPTVYAWMNCYYLATYDGEEIDVDREWNVEGTTINASDYHDEDPYYESMKYTYSNITEQTSLKITETNYTVETVYATRTLLEYTVTYQAKYNGSIISSRTKSISFGTSVSSTTFFPIASFNNGQYTYYSGSGETKTVQGATTVTTTYSTRELSKYTITFSGTNGSWSTASITADYGTAITRSGNTVTIGDKSSTFTPLDTTVDYTYGTTPTFSGSASVTKSETYSASVTKTARTYTIKWLNGDGSVLETDTNVAYNAVLTYNSETPTKTKDAQYTYTFSGWKLGSTVVTSGTTKNPGSTSSTTISIQSQFSTTINNYTVTYAYAYGTDTGSQTATVAYGTSVSSTDKYPATWVKTTNNTRWIGTGETKTVTGDTTVTTTYTKTQYYATISNSNSTSDKSTGWLDAGTVITFTTSKTATTTDRYSYSTSSSTTKTCTATVNAAGTFSPTTLYHYQSCTFTGTNCSANVSAGFKRVGTTFKWNANSGTNYKYSFTNTSVTVPTTSETVTITEGTYAYSKTASYVYYNVTISVAANCTANYTSGYILKGTTVTFTATASTSTIRYSFSNSTSTTSTTTATVSSAGQAISSGTVYIWRNVTIAAKYGSTTITSTTAWAVDGSTVNSSSYYNTDPWNYTAQYQYSGKTTNSITVSSSATSVNTTYSTRTTRSYTVTYQGKYNGSVFETKTASVAYGSTANSSDKFGTLYTTAQYTYSNGTTESKSVTGATTVTTTYSSRSLNSYTVTFSATGGSSWSISSLSSVPYGSTISSDNVNYVTITYPDSTSKKVTISPPADDEQFTYKNGGIEYSSTTITGNMTISGYSNNDLKLYTVIWDNDLSGIEYQLYTAYYNDTLTYSGVTPTYSDDDYDYTFDHWEINTDGSTVIPGTTKFKGDKNGTVVHVDAMFTKTAKIKTYTVSVSGSYGSVTGTGTFTAGTSYSVVIAAGSGYYISSISGGTTRTGSGNIVVDGSSVYSTYTVTGTGTAGQSIVISVGRTAYHTLSLATNGGIITYADGKYSNGTTWTVPRLRRSTYDLLFSGNLTINEISYESPAWSEASSDTNWGIYIAGDGNDDRVMTSFSLSGALEGTEVNTKTLDCWVGNGTGYTWCKLHSKTISTDATVTGNQVDSAGYYLNIQHWVGYSQWLSNNHNTLTVTNTSTGVSRQVYHSTHVIGPYSTSITVTDNGLHYDNVDFTNGISFTQSLYDYYKPWQNSTHGMDRQLWYYGTKTRQVVQRALDLMNSNTPTYWSANNYVYTINGHTGEQDRNIQNLYQLVRDCYYNYTGTAHPKTFSAHTKTTKIYYWGSLKNSSTGNTLTIQNNKAITAGDIYTYEKFFGNYPIYGQVIASGPDGSNRYMNVIVGDRYDGYQGGNFVVSDKYTANTKIYIYTGSQSWNNARYSYANKSCKITSSTLYGASVTTYYRHYNEFWSTDHYSWTWR